MIGIVLTGNARKVGEVGMRETEKAIENLNTAKLILCNQQMLTPEMCIRIGQAVTDALTLLKEQEAKQAIKQTYHVMMNRDYENPVEVTRYDWLCPNCKSLLCRDIDVIDDNYHFCKVCGQAVKWDAVD